MYRLVNMAFGVWLIAVSSMLLVQPAGARFSDQMEETIALGTGIWSTDPVWPIEISSGDSPPFGSTGGSSVRILRYREDGSLYLEFGKLHGISGARPSVLVLKNLAGAEVAVSLGVDLAAGTTSRALPLSSFILKPSESREIGMLVCFSPRVPSGTYSGQLILRVKDFGEKSIPLRVGFEGRPVAEGSAGVKAE